VTNLLNLFEYTIFPIDWLVGSWDIKKKVSKLSLCESFFKIMLAIGYFPNRHDSATFDRPAPTPIGCGFSYDLLLEIIYAS